MKCLMRNSFTVIFTKPMLTLWINESRFAWMYYLLAPADPMYASLNIKIKYYVKPILYSIKLNTWHTKNT